MTVRRQTRFAEDRPATDSGQPGTFAGMHVRMISGPGGRPPTDVCSTDDLVVVTMEVAGLRDDDANVTLFNDAVVIDGERHLATCPDGSHAHTPGIFRGAFHVEVPLPFLVDPGRVEATYQRGILRIELPRQASEEARLPMLIPMAEGKPTVH